MIASRSEPDFLYTTIVAPLISDGIILGRAMRPVRTQVQPRAFPEDRKSERIEVNGGGGHGG